jgi:hypothetical protein
MVMGLHGGIPRGSSTFAYAPLGFVNFFGWLGKVRRGVGTGMSEPRAQTTVNGGFTFSTASFNI